MTRCAFTRAALADALVPADDAAMQLVRRMKPGQQCLVEAVTPSRRNMRQHALFFALMNKVAENVDTITADQLRKLILRRLGYCDEVKTKRGIEYFEKSMAIHAMKAEEFEELFRRAVHFICEEVLPVAPADLEREVQNMIADHRWEGAA